jgi:hypothetical protein
MTDHVFGDEDFFVNLAVVDKESITDELRRNLARACPGFDWFLFAGGLKTLNFDSELLVYVWPFD